MGKYFLGSLCLASMLFGQEMSEFNLGEINISETQELINKVEINNFEFKLHNQDDIAQALNSKSGIFITNSGGRAEKSISIRGFDSRRVSLYIDGIPMSMPYDGKIDYSRFSTSNLSQINVEKGFSSVMYGSNTMAGVVNLITKKPTKKFEGEIGLGITADNEFGKSSHKASIDLGSKQDKYYLQLSASTRDINHFNVSKKGDYSAGVTDNERDNSSLKDLQGNLKIGFTPKDNLEYVLGYSLLRSDKDQPTIATTDPKFKKNVKYWNWKKWDKDTYYFLSNMDFGKSYLKTRLYYDKFKNNHLEYKTSKRDTIKTNSFYDDYSYGGSVEYGYNFKSNTLKTSLNYKKDVHKGNDYDSKNIQKTKDNFEDSIYSVGLEDIYSITDKLTLISGVSYNKLIQDKIEDINGTINGHNQDSFDPQVGLFYDIDEEQKIGFSIAQKTHLATMKERYSRGGSHSRIQNPNLNPEKALHYELSYNNLINKYSILKTNIFFINVDDAIEEVKNGSNLQNQNVGKFKQYGMELGMDFYVGDFESGFNFTYLKVENDSEGENSGIKREGIPKRSLYTYAKYNFYKNFAYYIDAQYQDETYSKGTDKKNNVSYVLVDPFVVVNTKFTYDINDISLEVGIKNLFDTDYEYEAYYPESGREYFANFRYKF